MGTDIRRKALIGSLRAYRCAEPEMHVQHVAMATAKRADATGAGDWKSADAYRALVAAKDVSTATSELWKHSRRDFTTRFQWRTARLVNEDVDIARKSLW